MSDYWKKRLDELNRSNTAKSEKEKPADTNYWQAKLDELNKKEKEKKKQEEDKQDIAPVQTTQQNTLLQKGALDNGVNVPSVSKSILGTLADAAVDFGAGILGMGEKAADSAAQLGAWSYGGLTQQQGVYPVPVYSFNMKEREKAMDDAAEFIAKDLYDEEKIAKKIVGNVTSAAYLSNINMGGGYATVKDLERAQGMRVASADYLDNQMEADSVLGAKADSLVQSAGQLVATSALQATGIPWFLTTGVTAYGSELENAYREGATFEEAGTSAAISAGAEILTEKIGGIKFGGKSLSDALIQPFVRRVSNKAVRMLANAGIDALGEGGEEILSGLLSAVGQKMTYMDDKELNELFTSEDAFDSFMGGLILGGSSNVIGAVKSEAQGKDAVTGLTKNEQKVVDKVYKDEIAKQEKDGKKLGALEKNKLYDKVIDDMEKGRISTDTIEEVLGGDEYSAIGTLQSEADEFNTLYDTEGSKLSEKQRDRLAELKQKNTATPYETALKDARSKLSQSVLERVQNDRLVESYNDQERKTQDFEPDYDRFKGSKNEEAARKTLDNAVRLGANNSRAVHDLVDMAAQFSADTGLTFDFQSAEQIKAEFLDTQGKRIAEFEKIPEAQRTAEQSKKLAALQQLVADVESGKTKVNGNITESGIVLNLDSDKPLNRIIGHEVTHSLENAKNYEKLRDALFRYAKSKKIDIDKVLAERKLMYEGVKDADPEKELVADMVGDFLFSDMDYITDLSVNHRDIFQRIWDEIKYLAKVATAGSKEARELERVKRAFENAYRESGKQNEGTKYHISKEFEAEIDKTLSNKLDKSNQVKARDFTPELLVNNGVKDLPMLITQNHVKTTVYSEAEAKKLGLPTGKNINYHGLGKDLLVKAVDNMDDPSAIYRKDADHYLIITELQNEAGEPIMIPVKIDGKGTYNDVYIDENQILSAYGKKNLQSYLENNDFELIYKKRETALNEGVQYSDIGDFSDDNVAQKDADVKYSLSDSDYLDAVKRGDTETAQKMVDEAAKAAGYTIHSYHGTLDKNFTEFSKDFVGSRFAYDDVGFFFIDRRSLAEDYATSAFNANRKGRVIEAYLKAKKPLIVDAKFLRKEGMGNLYRDNDTIDLWDSYQSYFLEEAENRGADAIILDDGETKMTVVFDPNQIKSAEAITYDNSGNVIPLSERFNPQETDIRRSLSREGEQFAPTRRNEVYGRDIRLEQDIAPINTSNADSNADNAIERVEQEVAPVTVAENETVAAPNVTEAPLLGDADAPPLKVETVADRIQQKIINAQAELEKMRQFHEQAVKDYDEEIAKARAELDSKKNQNSKLAQTLRKRIERLTRLKADINADYDKRISDMEKRIENLHSKEYNRAEHRREKQAEYTALWQGLIGDTSTWKDMPLGLQYKTKTLRRILRSVVRDGMGNRDIRKADAIYDELETKYDHNEAQLKVESRKLKDAFREMDLTHEEDAYAQMLGELRHNPETELTENVVEEYYNKHKRKIDSAKVDKAIQETRKLYDDLIVRVNEVLKRQGMKEIPYRQGYFPHFTNPKQGWLGKLLNWKTIDTEIPTSIAGLTQDFKPQRSWQSFSQRRQGDTTDYSLYQGLDRYIHGALDWIYHIEDIQKRRALENYIRFTHSDEGIQKRINEIKEQNYDADEAQEMIDAVLTEAQNPLSGLVRELMNRTNTLANKKSSMDREMEDFVNRKAYSTMINLNNRVTANMVVGSLSSAMTNFIPMVQSWHQVSPVYTVKGLGDMIRSTIHDDGTIAKSDFLTNRLVQEENLYKTGWDKVADKAAIMMNVVDNITAQTVWRSKYLQNLHKGMSEAMSIKDADQFAKNLMGGRSRGNAPSIFDAKNPITKIFTAFQLEVANQYGYMFEDVPQDTESKARLVKGYATAFVGAYMYNALYSALVGRDAAFDPISIIEDLLKDLFGDDEEEPEDIIMNFGESILEEVPYVGGLLGGGRIPISSALPYANDSTPFESMLTDLSNGDLKAMGKEMLKPLYYLAMPVAGGQIKKTVEGLSMFSDDHPIAGSYTDSGKLRYPVDKNIGTVAQAALFGQYSSKNARDYFDNERSALGEKQIQEFIDVDIPIREYWEYREGLSGLDKLGEKADYIAGLDLPIDKKNLLINNIADRKEPIDLTGYEDYSSLDELDFATKYPESYAVAKAVGGYEAYSGYKDVINDFDAKDENGKSVNGLKKARVENYIFNELDIDYGQKIILFCSEFGSQALRDKYGNDIIDYLNSRDDISRSEMETILKKLGFEVDSKGNISW